MATDIRVPMTELDAVNIMLRAIGSVGVSSLLTADTNADAEEALQTLVDTSRDVQKRGWHWNTDKRYPLEPDPKGQIQLPTNCLKVDTVYASASLDLVERGQRLYDRKKHTYKIAQPVFADLVVALAFDCIPTSARWHIAVKAARRFAVNKVHSTQAFRFTQEDEEKSLWDLEQDDTENDDRTMGSSPHIQRMRRR